MKCIYRKIFAVFFLCIMVDGNAFSQTNPISIKAIYGKILLDQNVDLETIKDPTVKTQIASIIGSFKKIDYLLLSNGKESLFQYQEKLQNDGSPINKKAIGRGGGNGIYYLNIPERKLIHKVDLLGKAFRVEYHAPFRYDWKLHEEKKEIHGYVCYRATATEKINDFRGKATRHIEAWYSPELPSYVGPADFVGLPGMVLEGGSGNIRFRIKSLKIGKNEDPNIKKPTKGKLVTYKEFIDIFNNKMKEISGKER